MTARYVCLTHSETFDSVKLWDEHLAASHPGWNAGAWS